MELPNHLARFGERGGNWTHIDAVLQTAPYASIGNSPLAGSEWIEHPSSVLETEIMPLYDDPIDKWYSQRDSDPQISWFVAKWFIQLIYGSIERAKLALSGPTLWLHRGDNLKETRWTLLHGCEHEAVASLSFVNYGGKFRLEGTPTSKRAECFCPVWQLSQTKICWRVDTYEAGVAYPWNTQTTWSYGDSRNQSLSMPFGSSKPGTLHPVGFGPTSWVFLTQCFYHWTTDVFGELSCTSSPQVRCLTFGLCSDHKEEHHQIGGHVR